VIGADGADGADVETLKRPKDRVQHREIDEIKDVSTSLDMTK